MKQNETKLQHVLSSHIFSQENKSNLWSFSYIVVLPSQGQSNILSTFVMAVQCRLP